MVRIKGGCTMKKILAGAVLTAAAFAPAAGHADEVQCASSDYIAACINSYMEDENGYKADFLEVVATMPDGTFVGAFAGTESDEADAYRGTGSCYYVYAPGAPLENGGCLAVLQFGDQFLIITPAGDVELPPELP